MEQAVCLRCCKKGGCNIPLFLKGICMKILSVVALSFVLMGFSNASSAVVKLPSAKLADGKYHCPYDEKNGVLPVDYSVSQNGRVIEAEYNHKITSLTWSHSLKSYVGKHLDVDNEKERGVSAFFAR